MGKNLKGKELSIGICQRKDGRYTARTTDPRGIRREGTFRTVSDARNWLLETDYLCSSPESSQTVDEWYEYRISNREQAHESGMDPEVLQHLFGHASIKTTRDRYVHVSNENFLSNVKKFEMVSNWCQNFEEC